ncbi:MAG: sugar phosphate isomerase/epimerase family protein [Planctomycetota bacterium]
MNKIGFNLLVWNAVATKELFPAIERLKDIGYDGIEFSMGNRDSNAYSEIGRLLNDLDMQATAVNAPTPEANPASSDAGIRQAAIERHKTDIDMASLAGAKILCGPLHSAFAQFSNRPPTEDEFKYSADTLRAIGEYAEQAGMIIAVEAINRFECYLCNTMDQLHKICRLVNHGCVKAVFDTHHANIEEKSFATAIDKIASYLVHVHISENDRGTPGKGHIPFDSIFQKFREIGYQGWFTIESFSRNDVDFANAINVWREFSDPWEIAEAGFQFIAEKTRSHHEN